MVTPDRDVLLETLACDLTVRPAGAPGIEVIARSVRGVRREAETVIIEFAPEAADAVAAFVDAERRCCADLTWNLAHDPAPRLIIGATPNQLDGLEALFRSSVPS